MKWMLCLMIAMSFSVQAKDGKHFEEGKSKLIENITKRISILETTKSCISSASNREVVRECRKAQKSSMKSLKDDKKAWKSERKKLREARKANKNQ